MLEDTLAGFNALLEVCIEIGRPDSMVLPTPPKSAARLVVQGASRTWSSNHAGAHDERRKHWS